MELKLAVFFIVLACVGAEDQECGERKAGACVERMLNVILEDISEEEACDEMQLVADCLRNAADECLGEDRDPEIDRGLAELDTILQENCPSKSVGDEDIDKCFDDNQQYLLQCIPESMADVERLLGTEIDSDVLKCALFKTMTECILERSGEKCGAAARKKAQDELDNMPLTLREDCAARESALSFSDQLLEPLSFSEQLLDRKRK